MEYGIVRMWDESKGFGFIQTDDDDDLFVSKNDIEPTVPGKRLREGQRVGFDVRREMKGDRAIHVRLVNR
ncbi:MAG: cold shock domain-containing protein [Deferribacteres bacterium]|nr:cold shock domain-containing protein [candidate division KSB1 bacterium]MCB9511624.1 cold shock domain-containing protein [Deferribacteres bacterium]